MFIPYKQNILYNNVHETTFSPGMSKPDLASSDSCLNFSCFFHTESQNQSPMNTSCRSPLSPHSCWKKHLGQAQKQVYYSSLVLLAMLYLLHFLPKVPFSHLAHLLPAYCKSISKNEFLSSPHSSNLLSELKNTIHNIRFKRSFYYGGIHDQLFVPRLILITPRVRQPNLRCLSHVSEFRLDLQKRISEWIKQTTAEHANLSR